jgi:hypothetical protein
MELFWNETNAVFLRLISCDATALLRHLTDLEVDGPKTCSVKVQTPNDGKVLVVQVKDYEQTVGQAKRNLWRFFFRDQNPLLAFPPGQMRLALDGGREDLEDSFTLSQSGVSAETTLVLKISDACRVVNDGESAKLAMILQLAKNSRSGDEDVACAIAALEPTVHPEAVTFLLLQSPFATKARLGPDVLKRLSVMELWPEVVIGICSVTYKQGGNDDVFGALLVHLLELNEDRERRMSALPESLQDVVLGSRNNCAGRLLRLVGVMGSKLRPNQVYLVVNGLERISEGVNTMATLERNMLKEVPDVLKTLAVCILSHKPAEVEENYLNCLKHLCRSLAVANAFSVITTAIVLQRGQPANYRANVKAHRFTILETLAANEEVPVSGIVDWMIFHGATEEAIFRGLCKRRRLSLTDMQLLMDLPYPSIVNDEHMSLLLESHGDGVLIDVENEDHNRAYWNIVNKLISVISEGGDITALSFVGKLSEDVIKTLLEINDQGFFRLELAKRPDLPLDVRDKLFKAAPECVPWLLSSEPRQKVQEAWLAKGDVNLAARLAQNALLAPKCLATLVSEYCKGGKRGRFLSAGSRSNAFHVRRALALRKDLSEQDLLCLIETGDSDTLENVCRNEDLRLSDGLVMAILSHCEPVFAPRLQRLLLDHHVLGESVISEWIAEKKLLECEGTAVLADVIEHSQHLSTELAIAIVHKASRDNDLLLKMLRGLLRRYRKGTEASSTAHRVEFQAMSSAEIVGFLQAGGVAVPANPSRGLLLSLFMKNLNVLGQADEGLDVGAVLEVLVDRGDTNLVTDLLEEMAGTTESERFFVGESSASIKEVPLVLTCLRACFVAHGEDLNKGTLKSLVRGVCAVLSSPVYSTDVATRELADDLVELIFGSEAQLPAGVTCELMESLPAVSATTCEGLVRQARTEESALWVAFQRGVCYGQPGLLRAIAERTELSANLLDAIIGLKDPEYAACVVEKCKHRDAGNCQVAKCKRALLTDERLSQLVDLNPDACVVSELLLDGNRVKQIWDKCSTETRELVIKAWESLTSDARSPVEVEGLDASSTNLGKLVEFYNNGVDLTVLADFLEQAGSEADLYSRIRFVILLLFYKFCILKSLFLNKDC